MTGWSRVLRTLRSGVIGLAAAATLAGGIGDVSAATQVYGGSYESDTYGFSFEWDEGLWSVSEVETPNAEGLNAESVNSWGAIYALPAEGDASNCYDDILAGLDNGAVEIAPARFERPEPGGGVQGELVVIPVGEGADASDMYFYVGCRPLDDGAAVLNVIFMTFAEAYDLEQPNWQEFLATIEVPDEGSARSEMPEIGIGRAKSHNPAMPETGIAGDVYTHAAYGYALSWDESIWTARELEPSENVGEGIYLEGEASYALISSYEDNFGGAEGCLDVWTEEFGQGSADIQNVRPAPARYERPELGENAAGELFVMDITKRDAEMALYLECREIPETNSIIVFHFFTGVSTYANQLPDWQQVLDSVETLPLPEAADSGSIGVSAR